MFIKTSNNRGAALLITILVVSFLGLLAVVALRSTISILAYSSKITDAIAAEESANAGIEFGLAQCSVATATGVGYYAINIHTFTTSGQIITEPIAFNPNFTDQYTEVTLTVTAVGTNNTCTITTIGQLSKVYKRHQITATVPYHAPPVETHLACSGATCATVTGAGPNTCSTNADCSHLACSGATCAAVAGAGANLCSTNADCSHLACSGSSCVSVAGAGANTCSTNADCAPACKNSGVCTSDSQCCTADGYFCGAYACIGLGNPEMCSIYTYPPGNLEKVCRKQVCTGPGDCTRGVGQSCLDPDGQLYDGLCANGMGCAPTDVNGNYGKCCARSGSSFVCTSTSQCCPGSTCITGRCR